MRENALQSIVRKKYKKHKEKSYTKENILNRDFKASAPGKKFVTDITYISTQRTMMYLCTIIDLFNNEPVAWNLSDRQDKNLSIKAINKLNSNYNLKDCIIHSDQGIHYTNTTYVNLLKKLKVKQSMPRKGNCWDNAVAESFFSHYKCETIHLMKERIKNKNDVFQITEEYLNYYINERPQKRLNGLPPKMYKEQYLSN